MKMRKRNSICFLLAAVVILSFLLSAIGDAGEVRGVTSDTIKIGLIADLTGPTVANALPWRNGLRNSFRYHINEQGGINGRKIKFLVEDDRYSIPLSMAAFKKLVYKDKVLFLLGPSGSGQSVALFSQIKKEKIPTIVWSMSERMIKPTKRYIFNNVATYSDDVKIIISYIIKELKVRTPRIGIVVADNEFGKGGLYPAREMLKSCGLNMADEEILDMGALDATSQVLNLKRAKVDYVIVHHAISPTVALLRDARKYGLKAHIFGTMAPCDDIVIEMAREAARGFVAVQCFASWYDDAPGAVKLREVTLRYEPKKKTRSFYYTYGWVTPIFLAEAIRRAGRDLNGESFIEAMESIKGFDTGGLTGPLTYGVDDHKAFDHLKFFKADLDKKRFVPVTGWMKPED